LSGPRVLLADDHAFLLGAVTILLSRSYEIVGAVSDGMSLVCEALRLHPDVIVTDVTMPVLNGIDAVRKLKESGCNAKIVFLTIHREQEFVKACLAEGALGFVHKTHMKPHLIYAIREALRDRTYISFPKTAAC
jgi:DNA-binding NarL/FixJ family response regulator